MVIKINNNDLVITTDNAGSIGEKVNDTIKTTNYNLSYLTTKNAVMENLVENTIIKAIVFHNYCGDLAYQTLLNGINDVISYLDYEVSITSSTESNFSMNESAFGITVIGIKKNEVRKRFKNYAVIGKPLLGDEVLNQKDFTISFEEFMYLLKHPDVSKITTIGSQGINHRLKEVYSLKALSNSLDLDKSSGPSTCVLIEYNNTENFNQDILNKLTNIEIIKEKPSN